MVIRVDECHARWIRERHWHLSQKTEDLPDRGLILHLRSGGPELRRAVAEEVDRLAES